MTIRLDDIEDVVKGEIEDALNDELSTFVLEEIDDAAMSEVPAASFASYISMKVVGETGRGDIMQCVERDEDAATSEPSKDSLGTMTTSLCEGVQDEFFGDDSV